MTAILIIVVVAAFLVERRLMLRDMRAERRDWALERAQLINREPVRPVHDENVEDFNVLPVEGPQADELYYESLK